MNLKSDTQILKNFLETAPENDLLTAVEFQFDDVEASKGWLPIHLIGSGATKQLFLNLSEIRKSGIELSDNLSLRRRALDEFREKFNLPTKYR